MDIIFWKTIFIFSAFYWSVVVAQLMVKNYGWASPKATGAPAEVVRHDYIFNFLATLVGWLALYYFVFMRVVPEYPKFEVTLIDLFILFVAFVGIIGYLPHLIVNKGLKP